MKISLKNQLAIALTTGALAFSGICFSDTVIGVSQQAKSKQTQARPQKGMSKAQVEKHFGKPLREESAVGKPPISVWVYPDYSVYFEYDHVIHSVLENAP